ncbi:hypothetical protein ACHAW6_013166 [Cyclotella cf. meneghiniana]
MGINNCLIGSWFVWIRYAIKDQHIRSSRSYWIRYAITITYNEQSHLKTPLVATRESSQISLLRTTSAMFLCSICFESMPKRPWGFTTCGHVFHEDCCVRAFDSYYGAGPCPKCRVSTRFTRVFCPDVKEILDKNSRLRVTAFNLARGVSSLSIEQRSALSMEVLPKSTLKHIFNYLIGVDRSFNMLENLLTTCTTFNKIVSETPIEDASELDYFRYRTSLRDRVLIPRAIENIKRWQAKDDNILLHYVGGAGGVRKLVTRIIDRMKHPSIIRKPDHKIALRGDTVEYLTQVVQGHVIWRLQKANLVAIHRSYPPQCNEYPVLLPSDVNLVDEMFETEFGLSSSWARIEDRKVDLVSLLTPGGRSWKITRALAYQAGIVKLSDELSDRIATEICLCFGHLTINAFEECDSSDMDRRFLSRTGSLDDDQEKIMNYYTSYCPPYHLDDEGNLQCVILPRQIKDAAKKYGMRPLLGFGEFGAEWAAHSDISKTREIIDSIEQYYDDEGSDYESSSSDDASMSSCYFGSDVDSLEDVAN